MRKLHWVFILPALAGPVFAQISWVNCTVKGYEWSYNSLGQNPCGVAAYLASPCNSGTFNLTGISSGWVYVGPTVWGEDACFCNTVEYSLYSACAACQGTGWVQWSRWAYNCSSVSRATTYPFGIQNETRVPHWAYLDVAITDNWNATLAQFAGDSPETTAGVSSMVSTSTSVSATRASSTVVQSHSLSPSPNQHKTRSGKITGAIAGVLVAVLLLIGIISWYLRRWRSRAERQPVRSSDSAVRIAGAFGLPDPNHSMAIGRYYDPSDPATFPKMSETQIMPNRGNTYNDERTDSTKSTEYSGLPMV